MAASNTSKIARKGRVSTTKHNADTSKSTKSATGNATEKETSPFLIKLADAKAFTTSDADKAIAAIRSKGIAYKRLAHVTAIGIVMHWQQHGDMTKLPMLRDAIEIGMSKIMAAGFVKWVVRFTSFTYDDDAKVFVHAKKTERKFNLTGDTQSKDIIDKAGALNQPFFSASFGDRTPYSFDFDDTIRLAYDKMERALKRLTEGKANSDLVHIRKEQVTSFARFAKAQGVKLVADKPEESSVSEKNITLNDGTVAKGDATPQKATRKPRQAKEATPPAPVKQAA